MKDVNASIIDRYYASAIQTPALVLGQLSKLSNHHLGKLSEPRGLEEEPSALAVSGAGVAALSASGVSVYNTGLVPQWSNADAVGARRLLLTDDGTVYALYTRNARLFTAHSERSEEIADDK